MIRVYLETPNDDAARSAARKRCVGEAQPNLHRRWYAAEARQP